MTSSRPLATADTAEHTEPHTRAVELRVLDWRVVVGAALGIALGLALWTCVRLFAVPLAILVLSITIADALSPLVALLERWMPRTVAASVTFAALLILFGVIGWLVAPRVVEQAQQLLGRVPQAIADAEGWLNRRNVVSAQQIAQLAPTWLGHVGGVALTLPMRFAHSLIDVFAMFFLALYWLIAAPALTEFAESLFPVERRLGLTVVRHEISRAMGGYVRGAAIDAAITGSMAGVALYFAGIDYPVLLGVLTACGEMVPVIGPITVAIPAIGIGLMQSPAKGLIALAVYTAMIQLEGHVIAPNVMSRQTNISQALVIFAFIAGSAVGGLLGAIAAIPLAGAAKVIIVRLIAPAIRRWTGAAELVVGP